MNTRAPAHAAFLAALGSACALAVPVRAEEFFYARDENPLLRGFYLPLPSDSRLADAPVAIATLSVTNTVNAEARGNEELLVDGESTTLHVAYDHALAGAWRYRISLPVYHDDGGILDHLVGSWHQFFGFSQGSRPYFPKDQLVYFYSGFGQIDLRHAQTNLGDASGEVGWYAADDPGRTLSFWGGLKAPTGSVAGLTSDGAWDAAAWGHYAWRGDRWQAAAELGVSQPFGDQLFAGAAHRAAAFARGAVTRSLGPDWSLRAQLDGQTGRVQGTQLRLLGPSLQFTTGAVWRVRGRWSLQFGIAEDAAVNTAPDITFFLGIRG